MLYYDRTVDSEGTYINKTSAVIASVIISNSIKKELGCEPKYKKHFLKTKI